MKVFPVITLYQPWATWVVLGLKTIETRKHNRFKSLIGKDILIHAGNHFDKWALEQKFVSEEALCIPMDKYMFGAIIGRVSIDAGGLLCEADSKNALIDCHPIYNRYGLFLKGAQLFDPIPTKGSMGIWYYDIEKGSKVLKPKNTSQQLRIY